MPADRRDILAWFAGAATLFGLARQARASVAVVQGDLSPSFIVNPNSPLEPSRSPMKHAFVDTLVMLAELTVKPEKLEEFLDYTAANLTVSRSYPGNLAFELLLNEAQPNKIVFYEVWQSPKAQQEYMAWRVQAGDLTKLLSYLAEEPKFTPLRSVTLNP